MNNRNSRNHVANVKNYQAKHKKIYQIMVDTENDKDVIEWFDNQKRYSPAVRQLIRDKINGRAAGREAVQRLRAKRREQHVCIHCAKQDERTLSGMATCEECYQKARNRNVK